MKVFTALESHFGLQEFDFTILFMVRIMTLIALAALSYFYFEKPLRNKIKSLGQKKFKQRPEVIS